MTINLATVCDKNYLIRALTMYRSARQQMPDVKVWFMCMDEETKNLIDGLKLEGVVTKRPEEINDPELMAVKNTRTAGEFAMTTKAAWLEYILKTGTVTDGQVLAFVDADIFFFQSLEEITTTMRLDHKSIGITSHRLPASAEAKAEKVGPYNSGFEIFIIAKESRICLRDWRLDCLDWCYLKPAPGGVGDQRYLTYWPKRYQSVYDIPHKGVNAGSWNLPYFKLGLVSGRWQMDDDPLICYHFHRIQFYTIGDQVKAVPIYLFNPDLYQLYMRELARSWAEVRKIRPDWSAGFVTKPKTLRFIKQFVERQLKNILINK